VAQAAAEAAEAAAEAAEAAAEAAEEALQYQRYLEGATCAEEVAKKAAAALPAEDPVVLKAHREATMDASARHKRTRRGRLVAKFSRLSLNEHSRPRGGRHKVPAVMRADDWAFVSNAFVGDVKC